MNLKKKVVIGLSALLICSGAAYAKQAEESISVLYENIKIMINGNQITPKDANGQEVEPFTYNGTTYLPVRAISEALDKNVGWDGETSTVSITDKAAENKVPTYKYGDVIYENPLASENDVKDFVMEGDAKVTFPNGKMRLEGNLDPSLGQASNYVYWCDKKLPDSVAIEWEFMPLSDDGLAIMFFSADGQNGKDLFDASLAKRTGEYKQYHSSDINAFHVSYYRHSTADESGFRVCNLRKSAGFNMVAQGADPLPPYEAAQAPYKMKIIKDKDVVQFFIQDTKTGIELMPFEFIDDGKTYSDLLEGGYIGFRQKTPLVAEYSNLKVYSLERE